MHSDLLIATLNAPTSFFHNTDTGIIANRFNQDMDLIDMKLPMSAIGFVGSRLTILQITPEVLAKLTRINLSAASLCLIKAIFLCVVGKYFAITMPFLMLIVWLIQGYYLRTSRQVRLLDIEAKSPLYSHITETVDGISTIRAYRWQTGFQETCHRHINNCQKPYYLLMCLQQWLALVLDLVVMVMAVVLVAITTSFSDIFSPGQVGVALNLVLTFSEALSQAITSWTALETSIGAITRVLTFKDMPSESRPWAIEPPAIHDWPSHGAIVFDKVTAAYQFVAISLMSLLRIPAVY
jgi:ABC-type multidrug transport system fused ATPase/permease subunit